MTARASARTSPGAAWQSEELASAFLEERRHLIPALDVQEALIKRLLTRGNRRVERFLDLGAGAGALTRLVLEAHPRSTGVLVDFSEPMAAAAANQLAELRGRWRYVHADLAGPEWREALPAGERYDAVVSSFCIHHLPDDRKRSLYREIFDLLDDGGLFLNWEHVAAAGLAEGLFEESAIERLIEVEQGRENPRPAEEVARTFRERAAADGDILAEAETQCGWLRAIGFEQVDVYVKLPELALFGGIRGAG
jgi:tRNA (cmo5U34)-methyltransferase